jgi:hypothetical protein
MSASKLTVLSASGLLAAMLTAVAWSTPVAVPPGASDLAIPIFSGSGTPTVDELFDTGDQSVTKGGITVNFEEFAVKTSLNPFGASDIAIGFAILTSNVPTSLGALLHGQGGFMLSAESCDPFTSETALVCGKQTGTVSRSPGHGENLTFNSLGTSSVTPPGESMAINTSNVYGIFSNAPGFTKNSPVQVTDDGTTFSFTGIGLSSSPSSAPEPATLGLLSLGLLGTLLARRRHKRAAAG